MEHGWFRWKTELFHSLVVHVAQPLPLVQDLQGFPRYPKNPGAGHHLVLRLSVRVFLLCKTYVSSRSPRFSWTTPWPWQSQVSLKKQLPNNQEGHHGCSLWGEWDFYKHWQFWKNLHTWFCFPNLYLLFWKILLKYCKLMHLCSTVQHLHGALYKYMHEQNVSS